jgi:hypothetical protein
MKCTRLFFLILFNSGAYNASAQLMTLTAVYFSAGGSNNLRTSVMPSLNVG